MQHSRFVYNNVFFNPNPIYYVMLKSLSESKTIYRDNNTFMEGRCLGFFQGSNEIIGVQTFVSERS